MLFLENVAIFRIINIYQFRITTLFNRNFYFRANYSKVLFDSIFVYSICDLWLCEFVLCVFFSVVFFVSNIFDASFSSIVRCDMTTSTLSNSVRTRARYKSVVNEGGRIVGNGFTSSKWKGMYKIKAHEFRGTKPLERLHWLTIKNRRVMNASTIVALVKWLLIDGCMLLRSTLVQRQESKKTMIRLITISFAFKWNDEIFCLLLFLSVLLSLSLSRNKRSINFAFRMVSMFHTQNHYE